MQQKADDSRVRSMYAGDVRWALFSIAVLWATYAFVFWKIMPELGTPEVFWALAISGGLVLLFNTASIVALVAHYSGDKDHIYGLDLHYLDAMRAKA